MRFTATHILGKEKTFTDKTAPLWLTSEHTIRGSTMDNRWFWENCKRLGVGESIETDFHSIKRIE